MTPGSAPDLGEFIKSLSLTIEVDMLEESKRQLQSQLEEFDKMDEFMKYQTILSKISLLEEIYKYKQDDIGNDIRYIKGGITVIIGILILIALFV